VALRELKRVLGPALLANEPQALQRALEDVQSAVNAALSDEEIERIARRSAEQQNSIARKAFFPALAAAAGVRILAPGRRRARGRGPRLIPQLNFAPTILTNEFVDRNVKLISTLRQGVAEGVRDAVVRAQTFGAEDLANRLIREWEAKGVPSMIPIRRTTQSGEPVLISARKHARTIARDQIGTLNFQLARTRQTAAGITSFVWQRTTAQDPREDHLDLVGQTFTWSEGAGGIFPGSEINCQCSARAVIDRDQILTNGDFVNIDGAGSVFTERDIIALDPGPGALL
jgi:hypothetical protein